MKRIILLALLVLPSCAPKMSRALSETQKKFQDHTGFMLYDPARRKTLAAFNSDRYFTPASNTKILTLYTAMHTLGDSIPALRYATRGDSLIFWGTGDPSFLNRDLFNNDKVYKFLQNSPHRLFFSQANISTDPWGPGWAWDDFNFAFSAERSAFPVYSNTIRIRKQADRFVWSPALFQKYVITGDSVAGNDTFTREVDSNQITFSPGKTPRPRQWELPFRTSGDLLVELLSDTLLRQVDEVNKKLPAATSTLFSLPSDSLYARMMKYSDNLIAEHLLLLVAQQLSDTLDPRIAIRYAEKNLLDGLPDRLRWVDGSGISRYNLTTPRNIVWLWEKLYQEIPRARLFPLLATGGQAGTLKSWYAASPPFLFGKTGSLSNQISLSGYLITKKGKVLIFCFMNGNFVAPDNEIRRNMQSMLTDIRDHY